MWIPIARVFVLYGRFLALALVAQKLVIVLPRAGLVDG